MCSKKYTRIYLYTNISSNQYHFCICAIADKQQGQKDSVYALHY